MLAGLAAIFVGSSVLGVAIFYAVSRLLWRY